MKVQQGADEIRSQPYPHCYLCGARGEPLYQNLQDRIFDAPGVWNLKECPNPECGLIWLDPMPLEEDIGKAYRKYYTHQEATAPTSDTWRQRAYRMAEEGYLAYKYGYRSERSPFWKKLWGMLLYLRPIWRAELDFSVMYLPAQIGGHLLDVGCGSGQVLKFMQDLGWRVEGVDFDPAAVKNARRKGLQVRLGTLEAQEYPDNCFDAVTMSHLIEHVHEPLQLLRECYRVLKPGGHLVVVTPNGGSWGHMIFKHDWRGLEPPRHLHVFTRPSLRRMVEKASFRKLAVSTTIRGAGYIFVASRSIRSTGRHVMCGSEPRAVIYWARVMQFAEWAVLKAVSSVGEELVLMAKK